MKNNSVLALTVTWSKVAALYSLIIAPLFDIWLIGWKDAKTPVVFLTVLPIAAGMIVAKQGIDAAKIWLETRKKDEKLVTDIIDTSS